MFPIRTSSISNGHLAYIDVGDGPPVVLLHGGALDHRMWSRQIAPFAQRYRVIAPDLRGHGDSSTPTEPFRHCDDVAELLRNLDTGPATLVGLSLGASAAVDTAVEHPDVVRALVISGAGTSDPDWRDPWILEWLQTWTRNAQERDAEAWIETFLQLGNGPHRALDDLDPQIVAELREQAEKVIAVHVSDSEPVLPSPVRNIRARVGEIAVPVLALPGGLDSDDHIRMARELTEHVDEGSWTMIDGAAHYPSMERAEEFNRLVLDFLQRVGQRH